MPNPFPAQSSVVAYLRDSGHEDQELSVEQQEAQIRAWCLENNLLLTEIFTDAAAPGSSTIGRAAFLEMIRRFRTPGCQEAGVVVWKFNRFARDLDDAAFYKADLRRRGYIIHSINDSVPEGLDGRFFEAAIDWMNARYLEDLRTDIKRGQRHLVDQYGALGGTPPRGFKRQPVEIGTRRDGRPHIVNRWVPDPNQVETVRRAWQMRASGATYDQINRITHLYKTTNGYERFFSNRLYIGQLDIAGRRIENYCEPIIDQPLWDAVQLIQQQHAEAVRRSDDHPRRKASTFLLSGLIYCAQCGSMMNADIVQFRKTSQHRYEYYACSGQNRHNGCTARKIPRAVLENTILEMFAEIVLDPRVIQARHHQLQEAADQVEATYKREHTRLNRELRAIRRRIENLTELLAEKGKSVRSLLEKLADLEREETGIKTQLANLKKVNQPVPSLDKLLEQSHQFREILANPADLAKLSFLLHAMIHRITVELDPETDVVRGLLQYYDPPSKIESGSSYDDPDQPHLYDLTTCPRRDSNSQPKR